VLSFGAGQGPNFFASNQSKFEFEELDKRGDSSSGKGTNKSKVIYNKDLERSPSEEPKSHIFSFQQKSSPERGPYKPSSSEKRNQRIIEEVEEEARSSKDEFREVESHSLDEDSFVEKDPLNGLGFDRTGRVASKNSQNTKQTNHSIDPQKISIQSNRSTESRESSGKYNPNIIPHYHNLLQKGKQIDLKPGNKPGIIAEKYFGERPPTHQKYEESRSKVANLDYELKTESHRQNSYENYESAKNCLVKNLNDNYLSKESVGSFSKGSKGRELSSFNMEGDHLRSSRDHPESLGLMAKGTPLGTHSLEANKLFQKSGKEQAKKVQSTEEASRTDRSRGNGMDGRQMQLLESTNKNPITPEELRRIMESRRAVQQTNSPVLNKNAGKENIPMNPLKQSFDTGQLLSKVQAPVNSTANNGGYWEKHQKKASGNIAEEKTTENGKRNLLANYSKDQKSKLLDKFMSKGNPQITAGNKGNALYNNLGAGLADNFEKNLHQHIRKSLISTKEQPLQAPLTDRAKPMVNPVIQNIIGKSPLNSSRPLEMPNYQKINWDCGPEAKFPNEQKEQGFHMDHKGKAALEKFQKGAYGSDQEDRPLKDRPKYAEYPVEERNKEPESLTNGGGIRRVPSAGKGVNIRIDIGSLSNKVMHNIHKTLKS
jgi:hypothetical protein